MAKFFIYSSDGTTLRASGRPTYNGSYLGTPYIEFREICSPTPITWGIGDKIAYYKDDVLTFSYRDGLEYKLYDIPQPTKKAASGESGEAFVYSNVQFYCALKDLEICPFRDIVPIDNVIHFSTQPDISTFEPLSGIVDRLNAILEDFFGSGVWNVVIDSATSGVIPAITEAREFSVSGVSVLEALNKCYDIWDNVGWDFTMVSGVKTITLGRPNIVSRSDRWTPLFEYGKGKGLVNIQVSQTNKDEFGTRLYPFGSSRNMNFQYYRGNTDILNAASLDIEHLMLPITDWGQTSSKYDAKKAYLENANAVATYGVRPKYHYFDGSEDDEIYPSIKGMTIKKVRDGLDALGITDYRPSTTVYTDETEKVDVIKSCSNPLDDGITQNGQTYTEKGTQTVTATTFSSSAAQASSIEIRHTFSTFSITHGGKITINFGNIGFTSTYYLGGAVTTPVLKKAYVDLYRGSTLVATIAVPAASEGTYEYSLSGLQISGECSVGTISLQFRLVVTFGSSGAISVLTSRYGSTFSYVVAISLEKTFQMSIKQIGFDINTRQALGSQGLATIFMNSGMCAGRSFVIKSCDYVSETDSWSLTCVRAYDESVGMVYPNNLGGYPIVAGDEFVLLDIAMPELYIKKAEQELKTAATTLLRNISTIKKFFTPSIDSIKMAGLSDPMMKRVKEGFYMRFKDISGTEQKVLIDTITISESDDALPTYKVTLREEKSKTFVSSVQSTSSSTPYLSESTSADDGSSSGSGSSEGTDDYTELNNLPTLNGITIVGTKTSAQFGLASATDLSDAVTTLNSAIAAKANTTYVDTQVASAIATAEDYSNATNKPQIEGHELGAGNNSAATLGIATSAQLTQAVSELNAAISEVSEEASTMRVKPMLVVEGLSPNLRIYHPALGLTGYKVVLMVYNKKVCRGNNDAHTSGKKKGWSEAQGRVPMGEHSYTTGSLTIDSVAGAQRLSIELDDLYQFILNRYCAVVGLSQATMETMTITTWRNSTANKGFYGEYAQSAINARKSKKFGIAVRWENPAFSNELIAGHTLKESTRMINGVPRYFYSEVAPIRIQLNNGDSQHINTQWGIGIL